MNNFVITKRDIYTGTHTQKTLEFWDLFIKAFDYYYPDANLEIVLGSLGILIKNHSPNQNIRSYAKEWMIDIEKLCDLIAQEYELVLK